MRVAIFGCGENAVQAFHCLRHDGSINLVGFLDENRQTHGQSFLGRSVLGGLEELGSLERKHGVEGVVVAVGDCGVRKRLTEAVQAHQLRIVSAIHPKALIESPREIGEGSIIEMGAAIHPEASIGPGVFIGGGAIIAHHSSVGAFSLIAGGVVFGGHVTVGSETLLGVGVSVKPHVTIGSRVTVGVGAAVISDLPDGVVAMGVPAKIMRGRG